VKAIEQSLKSSRQTVLGAALREPNTGGLTSRVYRYVVKGDSSAELMLECGSVGQNNV
jgi:predicted transcriptional regulator